MQDMAKFLFEMGQLKRVQRSGWWIAGISQPESVAEHSFRTAMIGCVLAHLEHADMYKTVFMCLFHDNHESRTNDQHKIARRYIEWGIENKLKASQEQLALLPEALSQHLFALVAEFEEDESIEAQIAHDADQLECLVQAREYQSQGFIDTSDWIRNCRAALITISAIQLADQCIEMEPKEWWQGLKVNNKRGLRNRS